MLLGHKRKREKAKSSDLSSENKKMKILSNTITFNGIDIPTELAFRILFSIDAKSLTEVSLVNLDFHYLSNDNYLWRSLLAQDYPTLENAEDNQLSPKVTYVHRHLSKKYEKIKDYFPGIDKTLVMEALQGNNRVIKDNKELSHDQKLRLYFISAINGNTSAQNKLIDSYRPEDLLKMFEIAFKIGNFEGIVWLWENNFNFILSNIDNAYQILPMAYNLSVNTFSWLWEQIDQEKIDKFTCRVFVSACLFGKLEIVKLLCRNYENKIDLNQGFCSAAQRQNLDILKWMLENMNISEQIVEFVLTGNIIGDIPYPEASIRAIKECINQNEVTRNACQQLYLTNFDSSVHESNVDDDNQFRADLKRRNF